MTRQMADTPITTSPATTPPDPLAAVVGPVDALLGDFLRVRCQRLRAIDPALPAVADAVRSLVLAGGKRMRPAFVYWGYRATGAAATDRLWSAAAAVELLQTFALIHDDVMDRSVRRRGAPSVHVALSTHHRAAALDGDSDWFGVGAAILAGDLAFVWADELFDAVDVAPVERERARVVFTELRTELMAGQYLDLMLAASPLADPAQAQRVALLKAGRYTVTRPLQLGAALAGVEPDDGKALAAYGDAVGVAFQLRDDVLGLFGDAAATGKGVLDDLRQGKRTVLMLETRARCEDAARAVLDAALGNAALDESGADAVRQIVVDSGALDVVERRVRDLHDRALEALEPVPAPAAPALRHLATQAVFRDH